jgi:hypothetical protein
MGFSHSGRAEQNDVGGFMHEPQRTHFADLALVDGRLKGEVELIERLHVRQVSQLQSRFQIALPPSIGLGTHHFQQEVAVSWFFLRRSLEQRLQARVDGSEIERGECSP